MSSKIRTLQAREILDSRGDPTVEVHIVLENGGRTKASVPSGATTGTYEALELRDGDSRRFKGLGVLKAGYRPGDDISIALDIGAPSIYNPSKKEYVFKLDHSFLNSAALIQLYEAWTEKYPILSIEDGLDENDWEGWQKLSKEAAERWSPHPYIVADDLFATNSERLIRGINEKAANAVIIKPNQVGTVSETIDTIKLAHQNKYAAVMCHRSGETNDDFIADFAVGV